MIATEEMKDQIVKYLDDKKAENIAVLDLIGTTNLARYMIFANGRSTKNIAAIADHVTIELKKLGHPGTHIEGLNSEWVLVDAGDIIIHIFIPEARAHFKLEELWRKK